MFEAVQPPFTRRELEWGPTASNKRGFTSVFIGHYLFMDYNLDSLGSRNFEHLTQALVAKLLGPKLVVFGDGPDGGREATWRGKVPSLGTQESWEGYGVLQAKFKLHTDDPGRNLVWLKSAIRSELSEWARSDSKRIEKPDFFLFVTNVRLSSVPDSGKDEINNHVRAMLLEFKLEPKDFRVWDYYDLIAQLDNSASIRKRYAAFITPGDVIATLLAEVEGLQETFGQAIAAYTARCLRDENLLNLTQAGTAGDGQVTIGEVFIDLPADLPPQSWLGGDSPGVDGGDDFEEDEEEYGLEFERFGSRTGIAEHLVNDFNNIPDARREGSAHPHRTVLIGGPGQGKSTVTQWLAQMYRTEFLRGSPIAKTLDVLANTARIDARRRKLKLPSIQARRWPIRIVLTDLADYLAKTPERSLFHYIASKISERSSFEIDPLMLRRWLANYPWLILIDGLDEVPASSNRQQVMAAIGDFFLDAAAIGGDVAAVATTRPQGYSEEFSAQEYRHFQLNTLTVDEALSYAEGLVAVRAGDGTPTAKKVMDRLSRASREEHTKKLFESPLQITILEVLLEKLGKAPSDRSRLYSAYYSVISQREQEKSGALSDLLQRFESDVDYLHRRIGFELQQRGSEVGETSSSLSVAEFDAFIVERFRDQGHPEDEVTALSRDFSDLVTDRLVFLAKLQADRIGFELRSLQEFMAGEHIVNLPEREVIAEIQRVAPTPYWRNVVLFAIGSIFAHREHLRAEAVLLCDRLNDEPKSANVVLPGAELAVDVLRDGSCLSMPKYARSLGKNALRLMESPHGIKVKSLLFMRNTDLDDMFMEEIESVTAATSAQWINRASLLSSTRGDEGDRADIALHRLIEAVDSDTKRHLIQWAWETWDRGLAAVIGDQFLLRSPNDFSSSRSGRQKFAGRRDDGSLADWMKNLLLLSGEIQNGARIFDDPALEEVPIRALCQHLGADQSTWQWVRGLVTDNEEWLAMISLADFAVTPSAHSLADALDAMSGIPDPISPAIAPWPYVACLRFASHTARIRARSISDVLSELATASRRGELGDVDDWTNAQDRWGKVIGVTDEFIEQGSLSRPALPMTPRIKFEGFVPCAYNYTAHESRSDSNREDLTRLIRKMLKFCGTDHTWMEIAVFLASLMVRRQDPLPTADMESLFDLISARLPEAGQRAQWISWLELVPVSDDRPDPDVLRIVGSQPRLIGRLRDETAEALFKRADAGIGGLPLIRLALTSMPSLMETMPIERLAGLDSDSTAESGAMLPARRLLAADIHSLWMGSHDHEYEAIVSSGELTFGSAWFTRLLSERAADNTQDIAARGAIVVASSHPEVAERWLEIAWKRTRSRAAPIVG